MTAAPTSRSKYVFECALLEEGWRRDVAIAIADGVIESIEANSRDGLAERIAGVAVPGLTNLHSIAIERALAGFAERGGESAASRRELRARIIGSLTPDDVEAIAALAHMEMLESGFTAVAEFQPLHLGPDGKPYVGVAEMTARVIAGADLAGITLTVLPVLQTQDGFGPRPAAPGQRRATLDLDGFRALMAAAQRAVEFSPGTRLGLAFESLRTVTIGDIRALIAEFPDGPVHMPVAADDGEIAECLAVTGTRPVAHLLDWVPVDPRWCLVHATYLSGEERGRLAHSGAVVGLAPLHEADRAEAVFDVMSHLSAGGRFGLGTAGNVRTAAAETMRQLEYGQRQRDRASGALAGPGGSIARALYDAARLGGAQAGGRALPVFEAGAPADILVLDTTHPALVARHGDRWLDGWVFAAGGDVVRDVWSGGRHVVKEGRHRDRARITRRYRQVMERLFNAV